ncbi:MAG: M48 family metalloprotease [Holosporaceae bacterium]|jgi:predicted Zn-dependent protease|nr:M48 family metalloprotease [Holosporaceae bacterium]
MKALHAFLVVFFVSLSYPVWSDGIIRDVEIEEVLTELAKRVFTVAKLRPSSAKVFVIKSNSINAFTIGNGYIFVTTGLLFRFSNPLQILAIFCHETAHIAAEHINCQIDVAQRSSKNSIMAMIIGMLGVAVTKRQEALALLLGYEETAWRLFARFTRTQEMAADALAVVFLRKLGYDADVFIGVLDIFRRMDIINGEANLPLYVRSHPKTEGRIRMLLKSATGKQFSASPEDVRKYERILSKLQAYLTRYDVRTTAPIDEYPMAIYLHRTGRSTEAIATLRKLVAKSPEDIYLQETLAQTLYEAGLLDESIEIYKKVHSKNPHTLIKIGYARALIAAKKNLGLTISMLESIKLADDVDSEIYGLLGKAYGLEGREGMAIFTLAIEQMLLQNFSLAAEMFTACLRKLDLKKEAVAVKNAKYYIELIDREYLRK